MPWIIGLRGVDRIVGLVFWPGIWPRGRLGACVLRSSTRPFVAGYMGCGQQENDSGVREALVSCHTIVSGGCVGMLQYSGFDCRVHHSNSMCYYLLLKWFSAVTCISA